MPGRGRVLGRFKMEEGVECALSVLRLVLLGSGLTMGVALLGTRGRRDMSVGFVLGDATEVFHTVVQLCWVACCSGCVIWLLWVIFSVVFWVISWVIFSVVFWVISWVML
jgi:hypothetical protein